MAGLQLNPNKQRLTLAPSVHVHTNEQTTDRVSGDRLVLSLSNETTDLRGRDREQSIMLEAEREGECVTPSDIETKSNVAKLKD